MAKFQFTELVDARHKVITARLGIVGGTYTDKEVGKLVRQTADSRYELTPVGAEIEGFIVAMDSGSTQDQYSLGSVQQDGRLTVVLDGLQATPGVGTIAIGDFVVTGTPVAKDTSLGASYPKACKATAAGSGLVFTWRVVSMANVSGAVGVTALIERV